MKLIDKDALVTEIEGKNRKIFPNADWYFDEYTNGYVDALKDLLSFLDTLEVKEEDLEKEIGEVIHNYKVDNHRHTSICSADIEWIAKHFFELGLKIKKE